MLHWYIYCLIHRRMQWNFTSKITQLLVKSRRERSHLILFGQTKSVFWSFLLKVSVAAILHTLNVLYVWSCNANVASCAPPDFELRRTFLSCRVSEHKDTVGDGNEFQFCAKLHLIWHLMCHKICWYGQNKNSELTWCKSNYFTWIKCKSF